MYKRYDMFTNEGPADIQYQMLFGKSKSHKSAID